VVGFLKPEQLLAVAEAVVTTQRDFGDRTNRKHARLKYTIDDRGLDCCCRDHPPPGFVSSRHAR
jgi:sulfite reductase (NADPH) hemoprotein beta-component